MSTPHTSVPFPLICNACDAEPMAPGQEQPGRPGYCADCFAEAQPIEKTYLVTIRVRVSAASPDLAADAAIGEVRDLSSSAYDISGIEHA